MHCVKERKNCNIFLGFTAAWKAMDSHTSIHVRMDTCFETLHAYQLQLFLRNSPASLQIVPLELQEMHLSGLTIESGLLLYVVQVSFTSSVPPEPLN